jgi:hypothetical protein
MTGRAERESACPTYTGIFALTGKPVYQIFKNEEKQFSLVVGTESKSGIMNESKILHRIDSVYKVVGIARSAVSESWNARTAIGIQK